MMLMHNLKLKIRPKSFNFCKEADEYSKYSKRLLTDAGKHTPRLSIKFSRKEEEKPSINLDCQIQGTLLIKYKNEIGTI